MVLTLSSFFFVSAILLLNSCRFFRASGSVFVCLTASMASLFLSPDRVKNFADIDDLFAKKIYIYITK